MGNMDGLWCTDLSTTRVATVVITFIPEWALAEDWVVEDIDDDFPSQTDSTDERKIVPTNPVPILTMGSGCIEIESSGKCDSTLYAIK